MGVFGAIGGQVVKRVAPATGGQFVREILERAEFPVVGGGEDDGRRDQSARTAEATVGGGETNEAHVRVHGVRGTPGDRARRHDRNQGCCR